jgi:hypothetical protein
MRKEQLSVNDFGGLWSKERVESKYKLFNKTYNSQKKKGVFRAMIRTFRFELIISCLTSLIAGACNYASPFIIHKMVIFIRNQQAKTEVGFMYLGILIATQIVG